jgi:hypothetical protein
MVELLVVQRGTISVDQIYLEGYPGILGYFGSHHQKDSRKNQKVLLQISLARK